MDVSFSELEDLARNPVKDGLLKVIESSGEEVDRFLENCSSLYNLILDSLHNLTSKTISCECLDEMTSSLEKSARKILAERPEAENSVLLRLNTICCAMEQLRVQHSAKLLSGAESDTSSSTRSTTSSSTGEMRSWLHEVERRLELNEKRIRGESNLNKLLSDQQALQLEIQHEGQLLVNRLDKQLKEENDTDPTDEERRKTSVDAIRKRWHTIYLNSLSLVCRIEELINHQQLSDESETDPDLVGPPIKRARTRTCDLTASDTEGSDVDERHSHTEKIATDEDNVLPFAESEYESIMDGRITVDSCASSSEDQMGAVENKKWGSVQQDVGYSSGENSIHEALNTCADHLRPETSDMRRKRIECSPVKAFYRTVQLEEMSDLEVTKAINQDVDEEPNLSDSMYVNHDSAFTAIQNLPEYDEVMALMDSDVLPMDMSMTESFNTQWREIHGQKKPLRRASRPSREQMDMIAKSSCDASSEDSSEGECPSHLEDDAELMSLSFNSASFDTSSPLKRQRSGRGLKNASFLYDSLEMDGSFCSTRSEMPPCKSRSLARRKLRVRRMPRSMSDGEQLGVVSSKPEGLLTPMIRVSPPSTPVTRLLRKLDDQIRNSRDSDTAPEHSDAAQAYEWDEYNPPQKDDSATDRHTPTMTDISNQLMNIDDDFAEHFGGSNAIRLIEESKSHLRVVQKALEESNANMPQLSNFELIARSNLRQVDEALKIQSGYQPSFLETSTLQDLRAEWSELYESIRSPFVRIMHQVKKFAATLQEVSSMASLGDVVDIRSKEDVTKALEAVTAIERRLSCERQELRELVSSPTFREVANDLSREFDTVSEGYDDAVDRIGKMANSLSHVNGEWDAWNNRQNDIRSAMVRIESHLKEGHLDNKQIAEEMELCQERMNSLETMCNYLTASLGSLQNDANPSKNLPDFKAELSIYSNALGKLKDRFNDMIRVPTPPPMQIHPPEPRPSINRSMTTQTSDMECQSDSEPMTVAEAISSSRLIKLTFALSLLSALAAIFYYHVFGKPFGPHVTYVNGPPPV